MLIKKIYTILKIFEALITKELFSSIFSIIFCSNQNGFRFLNQLNHNNIIVNLQKFVALSI